MLEISILIYNAISILFEIIEFCIFIRVILSWLSINRDNPIIKIIYLLTEPILAPIRDILYKSPLGGSGMMLDFSPVIAIILFNVILSLLRTLLF